VKLKYMGVVTREWAFILGHGVGCVSEGDARVADDVWRWALDKRLR